MTERILKIGIAEGGIVHTKVREFDLDTRFQMVKDAGVFDYYDKTPPPHEIGLYEAAVRRHGLPIGAGGFFYVLGRDEPLLDWHLRIASQLGARAHNVQIFTRDIDGRPVSDEAVAEAYLRAAEIGEAVGVAACFEVHVNMWSEHFGRVAKVGRLVEARGVAFNITLDHSHVIFKIDNPEEQAVQGMDEDIRTGVLQLDPTRPGDVCQSWIDAGWVRHLHARAATPNGPKNVWAKHPNGQVGRGIQYPFIAPGPGEWHSPWDEARLEPWKMVVRNLLKHHATAPVSRLETVTTEFIPFPDYGGGAGYSIFDNGVACAEWIRAEWVQAQAAAAGAQRA